MNKKKWSYKTVHFELKREGLLGGSFLDEAEIEEQLNDFGRSGWELISVIEVQDGIIAFFKQSMELGFSSMAADIEEESDELQKADDVYQANGAQEVDSDYEAHRVQEVDYIHEADAVQETDKVYDDEVYDAEDARSSEYEPYEQDHRDLEEEELSDQEDAGYVTSASEDHYEEFVEEAQAEHEDQNSSDEEQEYRHHRGIGAIRIE